jgi:hypothetical protein
MLHGLKRPPLFSSSFPPPPKSPEYLQPPFHPPPESPRPVRCFFTLLAAAGIRPCIEEVAAVYLSSFFLSFFPSAVNSFRPGGGSSGGLVRSVAGRSRSGYPPGRASRLGVFFEVGWGGSAVIGGVFQGFCGVAFRRVVRRYRGGGARGVLDATAMSEFFGPSSCRIPAPLGFLSSPRFIRVQGRRTEFWSFPPFVRLSKFSSDRLQIVRLRMESIYTGGIRLSLGPTYSSVLQLFVADLLSRVRPSVLFPCGVRLCFPLQMHWALGFLLLLCLSHGKLMISDSGTVLLLFVVGPVTVKEGTCIV